MVARGPGARLKIECGDGATMSATTLPQTEAEQDQQTRRQPPYNVILLNDDDHTYEYVDRDAPGAFGHPVEKGYRAGRRW